MTAATDTRPAAWPARALSRRSGPPATAHFLAIAAVACALTVSANLLTVAGIPYVTDEGAAPLKLHPASWLAFAAFATVCLRPGAPAPVAPLRRAAALLAASAIYAFAMSGAGNVIVLFDSFLPALCLAAALDRAPVPVCRRLRRAMQILLAANAALGVGEALTGVQLIPLYLDGAPYTPHDVDFRPTALFDHPLTAGAATVIGLFLPPDSPRLRTIYIPLLGCALIAFGGRLAIVTAATGVTAANLPRLLRAAASSRVGAARILSALAAGVCLCCLLGLLCAATGLGARLAEHAYWDESAATRLSQWQILSMLDGADWVFGLPRDALIADVNVLRLSSGVGVIENFWLLLFVTLGVPGFLLFAASFFQLLLWGWARSDRLRRALIAVFVVIASGSNSLGRKSCLLLLLVAAIAATAGAARTNASAVAASR